AFDVSPEAREAFRAAGGGVAGSLAELGRECDIVFLSLPTPSVVRAVALDRDFVGARVKTVIDLSTTGPQMAKEVGEALVERGVAFVDSPVSGGRNGALNGKLAIMAACPKPLQPRVQPLLEAFGKVFFVGDAPGQAQTMKLINNLMSVVAIVTTSEGMAMGVK